MSLGNALWFKLKALRKSRIALAPHVLLSANGASQVSAGVGQTLETRRVCFDTREDLLPSSWALNHYPLYGNAPTPRARTESDTAMERLCVEGVW
jgi:hypothetical protein